MRLPAGPAEAVVLKAVDRGAPVVVREYAMEHKGRGIVISFESQWQGSARFGRDRTSRYELAPLPAIVTVLLRSRSVRLVGALVSSALLLVCLATCASAASPHAAARAVLLKCEKALASVHVRPIEAYAPAVARAKRAATRVFNKCSDYGTMEYLDAKHHDKALADAYQAYIDLGLGSTYYLQYCERLSLGHIGRARQRLRLAQREIAQGRAEAKRALAEL